MASVVVVNEHDEVIGSKDRNTLVPSDIRRVVVLWVTNSNGDILLARRSLKKKVNPGLWGPAVAGHVDATAQGYEDTVLIEAKEELGLELSLHDLETRDAKRVSLPHGDFFAKWYFYKTDMRAEEFVLSEDEVDSVRWVRPEDLKRELQEHPDHFTASVLKMVPAILE